MVLAGRYGLGSKEFNARTMVKAVFDNLKKADAPMNHFVPWASWTT